MTLSKTLNKEKFYLCETCKKLINDTQAAISCCLCDYISHKKCNKLRFKNFVRTDSKNQFPICIECKLHTLPFQNQDVEKKTDSIINSDIKRFFDSINANNMDNIIEKNNTDYTPLNCEYVDYDAFNYIKDERSLSTLHMNIASLAKHKDEFETTLKILDYEFDIIGLTETKLIKNTIPTIDISLQGYNCYSTPTEASKGGTILYIKNNFHIKPRNDLDNIMYNSKELESSFIEIINPNRKNIVIGCIYRHPSMNLNEFNDHF